MTDPVIKQSDFFQKQAQSRDSRQANTVATPMQSAEDKFDTDYQSFLLLLTAQLEHQDPMAPMDPSQFLSQIAQFSTVEQQLKTNSSLEQMMGSLASSVDRLDFSFLGRKVEAVSDAVGLGEEGDIEFAYVIEGKADKTEILIRDENDDIVRTISGSTNSGRHDAVWDGKDDYGDRLPEGAYRISVRALDTEGEEVPTAVAIRDTVTEVIKVDGETWLSLAGGARIPPESVITVSMANQQDS